MINTTEIIALKRSGHHAMFNWLILNLTHRQIDFWYKYTRLGGTNTWVLNDGSANQEGNIDMFNKEIEYNKITPKNLLVNYEDTKPNFTLFNDERTYNGKMSAYRYGDKEIDLTNRIYFIRDFYDNLFSRYLSVKNEVIVEAYYDERFINIWKDHAKNFLNNKKNGLKYEEWILDKNKREEFINFNFGISESFDSKNIHGTTTSNVNNIEKDYTIIPDDIKELVYKDNELHYLIGSLGYEYKEL